MSFPDSLPSAGFQRITSLPTRAGEKKSVAAQCERRDRRGQRSDLLHGLVRICRIPNANELVRAGGDDLAVRRVNEHRRHLAGVRLDRQYLVAFSIGTFGSIGKFQPLTSPSPPAVKRSGCDG